MKALSSNIDDRTLHELYSWPFAEVIRSGVGAVMTSYNDVNGSACSQNSYLINGILKDEFGFQGIVRPRFLWLTALILTTLGDDRFVGPDQRRWIRYVLF
jgi:hypothetical protein